MSRNGRRVNAKSIMGVMMLAAGLGSEVELETDGDDEQRRWTRWSPSSTTSSAKASNAAPAAATVVASRCRGHERC